MKRLWKGREVLLYDADAEDRVQKDIKVVKEKLLRQDRDEEGGGNGPEDSLIDHEA